jgi:hypothetical protein
MTRQLKGFLMVVVAVGVLGFAGLYIHAQTPTLAPPVPQRDAARMLMVENYPPGPPVATKFLSDDVKLLVYRKDLGGYTAQLYVKLGGVWQPVAAEGLRDLEHVLPAH